MKAFNLLHLYRYTRYLSDKFQICRTRTSIVKIITRTYISSGKVFTVVSQSRILLVGIKSLDEERRIIARYCRLIGKWKAARAFS